VPEGDTIHRVAERLQALEGERLAVEAPHPRAPQAIAATLDGLRLERVEAIGKNLVLTFEGGLVLRSHLRMRGRWQLRETGAPVHGLPWLVLRGERQEAVLWHGPVLELGRGRLAGTGPDVMAPEPDLEAMLRRLRVHDQGREIGDALLDQRLVAGIGNVWRAEALFAARVSPWRTLSELSDRDVRRVLSEASRLMKAGRGDRQVYRRRGRPCPDCRTPIEAARQGADARTIYWCPACQAGTGRVSA
jgi:endonuclease VIII